MRTVFMPWNGVVLIRGSTPHLATMDDLLSAECHGPLSTRFCCEYCTECWRLTRHWLLNDCGTVIELLDYLYTFHLCIYQVSRPSAISGTRSGINLVCLLCFVLLYCVYCQTFRCMAKLLNLLESPLAYHIACWDFSNLECSQKFDNDSAFVITCTTTSLKSIEFFVENQIF